MKIKLVKNAHLSNEEITQHLMHLGEEFIELLESRVNIDEYSKKLSTHSVQNTLRTENDLVGVIAYYVSNNAKGLYISHVGIQKEWRKRNLASELVEGLFQEPYGNFIRLQVSTHNTPAKRLYEGLGFIATDTVGTIITMERTKNND